MGGGGSDPDTLVSEASRGLLFGVAQWQPFNIDALGLVTMLGADEVNNYFGQMLTNRWVDWMPQLGGFVIAGSKFREPQTGFTIFNLDDGITTLDISSWLSRWLISRDDFKHSISKVEWKLVDPGKTPKQKRWEFFYSLLPFIIGVIFNGGLLVFSALQPDPWGIVNTVALIFMICVRQLMVVQTRNGLDRGPWLALSNARKKQKEAEDKSESQPDDPKFRADAKQAKAIVDDMQKEKRLFCILPNGHLISMTAPKILVTHGMTVQSHVGVAMISEQSIDKIKERYEEWGDRIDRWNRQFTTKVFYRAASWIGWAAFAVHVIAIGQAFLTDQLITVFAIIVSTLISTYKIGCNDNYIASTIKAERGKDQLKEEEDLYRWMRCRVLPPDQPDKRIVAYTRWIRQGVVDGEPQSEYMKKLLQWQLVPQLTNKKWHDGYAEFVKYWEEYDRLTPEQIRHEYKEHEKLERARRIDVIRTRRQDVIRTRRQDSTGTDRAEDERHKRRLFRRDKRRTTDIEGNAANGAAVASPSASGSGSDESPNKTSAVQELKLAPTKTDDGGGPQTHATGPTAVHGLPVSNKEPEPEPAPVVGQKP